MLRLGYTELVDQDDQTFEHIPTGRLFISPAHRDTFARNWQEAQGSGESAPGLASPQPDTALSPQEISPEVASRLAPAPAPQRQRTRKYSNRDRFVELLGMVVDTFREGFNRDPTIEEIAYASDKTTGGTLWPEGMSPTTLKKRLKDHDIELTALLAARSWPRRHS
jgi:hypothetical protein